MEYWNFQINDERKRSNCSESATIDHIDEHLALAHERNKIYYLMKKNESLRNNNQQFATSYENLKMQINDLLLERTVIFEKNVSLLYEKNHLKRELMSYKEVLNKTSSRNKAMLLNMKSAYDELVKNTSILDEFIASLPRDNGEFLYDDYPDEDDNYPRLQFNTPKWEKICPYKPVLTPIQEESYQSSEPCSSTKKSRLGRNPLRRIDNILAHEISDITAMKWDPAKQNHKEIDLQQLWRTAKDESKEKPMKSKETNDCICDDGVELTNNEISCSGKVLTYTPESDEMNKEQTFTVNVSEDNKITQLNENHQKFIGEGRLLLEEKKNWSLEDNQLKGRSELKSFKQMRSFFPPLQDKIDGEKSTSVFERYPPTPISSRQTKLICDTPRRRDFSTFSIFKQSLEVKGAEDDCDHEAPSQVCNKSVRESSYIMKSSSKKIPYNKLKRKLNESKHSESGVKMKKRKSVFEVLDDNIIAADHENIISNEKENILNLNNVDQIKKIVKPKTKESTTNENESDIVLLGSKTRSRSKQASGMVNGDPGATKLDQYSVQTPIDETFQIKSKEKTEDSSPNDNNILIELNNCTNKRNIPRDGDKIKSTSKSRSNHKVNDIAPVVLDENQMRTRSKSKRIIKRDVNEVKENKSPEKTNGRKRTTKSKNSKNQNTSSESPYAVNIRCSRVKRKKDPIVQSKDFISPLHEKRKPRKKNLVSNTAQKENIDPSRYFPISTPKSMVDSSEPINFNEISISPINKMMQSCDQKTNKLILDNNLNNQHDDGKDCINHDKPMNQEQNIEVQNQKKYIVLADLLRSTANKKYATEDDINQIKRFLINIGSNDKKMEVESAENKVGGTNEVETPKEDSGISNNSFRDNINSLLSTLSPSLVSIIKSSEVHDNSISVEQP